MSDILKIKFYIHNGYSDEEDLDSFEIKVSNYETFGDLIDKITEERFVERGVVTLMFKNEMVFFDGSPENPGFKNLFKDCDVLTEFLVYEKSDNGIIELIYKEKEAGFGAFITTRKISSSKNVKIIIPTPSNKFEKGIDLTGGAHAIECYLARKGIFRSTLLLKVVTHERKINDEKTEYQYQQYEIKTHDSAGWEYTPNAPIFIEVLDNNEIVVKIDEKPITKTPLVSKTVEATEIEKDYYEKYVKKALDVCTVVGTVAAVLAIPGVIVLAV